MNAGTRVKTIGNQITYGDVIDTHRELVTVKIGDDIRHIAKNHLEVVQEEFGFITSDRGMSFSVVSEGKVCLTVRRTGGEEYQVCRDDAVLMNSGTLEECVQFCVHFCRKG